MLRDPPATLDETAGDLGVSRERVRQIEAGLQRKMRSAGRGR